MLDDPRPWPEGAGRYCVMNAGDLTENHNRFQLAPFTNPRGELSGLSANIMGLDFVLMVEPPILSESLMLAKAEFRPSQIVVTYPTATNWIAISWDDGKLRTNTMSLKFSEKSAPDKPDYYALTETPEPIVRARPSIFESC